MKHQLADGRHLYYKYHMRDNSGEAIVFVNGLSQSTLSWEAYVPAVWKKYNVLQVDLLFQGQSDKHGEHLSFEQHANTLIHLADTIGIRQLLPVGISYGGAVTQRLLVNYPDRVKTAVLMSTFAHKTAYFNAIGDSWKSALKLGGYALMLDVMLPAALGKYYFEHPLIPIADMKNIRTGINESREALLNLMKATEESKDYRQELRDVKCPVLIIHGMDDILTTPEMGQAIADAIPKSEYVLLKDKGHSLNIEAIPETIALIERFFEI